MVVDDALGVVGGVDGGEHDRGQLMADGHRLRPSASPLSSAARASIQVYRAGRTF